jgi:S-adenosylmethionine decarboxylase
MRHCLAKIVAPAGALFDDKAIFNALLNAAHISNLCVLKASKHEFHPQGMTAFVVLGESHLSIHTYPESGLVYMDAFTCGETDPCKVVAEFITLIRGKLRSITLVDRELEVGV